MAAVRPVDVVGGSGVGVEMIGVAGDVGLVAGGGTDAAVVAGATVVVGGVVAVVGVQLGWVKVSLSTLDGEGSFDLLH